MAIQVHFLLQLPTLCLLVGQSFQQTNKLRKRLRNVESIQESGDTLQEQITQMNDSFTTELIDVRSELMHTKQMNTNLTVELHKVKFDLRETTRVKSKLTLELQKVKIDLRDVISELLDVKSVLMMMRKNQREQVEENKEEMLGLRQLIMEMKQSKTEFSTVTSKTTARATVEPSTTTVDLTTEPLTATVAEPVAPTCSNGWSRFQNTCYLYVNDERVSWEEPNRRCADRGAVLAEPDTKEKMQFLWNIATNKVYLIWGGGRAYDPYEGTEKTWVWTGTERLIGSSSLWDSGYPNPRWGRGIEDCLTFYDEGWHCVRCTGSYLPHYICKMVSRQ